MTTDLQPRLPAQPTRLGQATAVEQSRAIAEVQAMVVVAQQCPRSLPIVLAQMRESCAQKALAQRSFYRYNRGGNTITGPSVHLARELARCFGNVTYGIAELRRDDDYGQSEMQAWAWDVQTNARSTNTFIVPHKRDKTGGPILLTDMRDIYENNTNNAARRLREAIFSILPPWFVEEAKDLCLKTLEGGGDKPLATRVADAVKAFGSIGVTADQLEAKLARPSAKWVAQDLAQLEVVYRSIQRNEVTIEDEFPPQRVTVEEIVDTRPPPPAKGDRFYREPEPAGAETATTPPGLADPGRGNGGPARPQPPPSEHPVSEAAAGPTGTAPKAEVLANPGQIGVVRAQWNRLGYDDNDPAQKEERLLWTSRLAGRTDVITSTNDLTPAQARKAYKALEGCNDRAAVLAKLEGGEQA